MSRQRWREKQITTLENEWIALKKTESRLAQQSCPTLSREVAAKARAIKSEIDAVYAELEAQST